MLLKFLVYEALTRTIDRAEQMFKCWLSSPERQQAPNDGRQGREGRNDPRHSLADPATGNVAQDVGFFKT
ncbi:MAG: hypothetical protein WAN86_24830, partial [Hyphomicrobiaceae bacterium]